MFDIFVSSDNRRYRVCEGDWEFRVESANAPVLIIEGLKIREPYVKLAFHKPWPVDQRFTITGEADGSFCVRMSSSGAMTVDYRFACRKKIESRQVGIVLDLPKRCDRLTWQRDARWTVYPDDHVGRPVGSTKSPRDGHWPVTVSGERPEWPWEYDESPLGTNDFRATRDIPEDAE